MSDNPLIYWPVKYGKYPATYIPDWAFDFYRIFSFNCYYRRRSIFEVEAYSANLPPFTNDHYN